MMNVVDLYERVVLLSRQAEEVCQAVAADRQPSHPDDAQVFLIAACLNLATLAPFFKAEVLLDIVKAVEKLHHLGDPENN